MESRSSRERRLCSGYVSLLVANTMNPVNIDHLNSLENLLLRYEEPSSMVRWDSPLFTIPWTDAAIPADEIWKAVTAGNVKPPNAGTQAVGSSPLLYSGITDHTSRCLKRRLTHYARSRPRQLRLWQASWLSKVHPGVLAGRSPYPCPQT